MTLRLQKTQGQHSSFELIPWKCQSPKKTGHTPRKFNSSPLKNDGWKAINFPFGALQIFRGDILNLQGLPYSLYLKTSLIFANLHATGRYQMPWFGGKQRPTNVETVITSYEKSMRQQQKLGIIRNLLSHQGEVINKSSLKSFIISLP